MGTSDPADGSLLGIFFHMMALPWEKYQANDLGGAIWVAFLLFLFWVVCPAALVLLGYRIRSRLSRRERKEEQEALLQRVRALGIPPEIAASIVGEQQMPPQEARLKRRNPDVLSAAQQEATRGATASGSHASGAQGRTTPAEANSTT